MAGDGDFILTLRPKATQCAGLDYLQEAGPAVREPANDHTALPMYEDTVSGLLATKPGEQFLSVTPDATVTYAVCLMNHHDVGAVLVMDGARLAGIFTERDVLRRVIEPGLDPSITRLHEVLSEKPVTISGADLAERALDVMVEGGFRHLPVVAGGRVEGIVSMRDLTGWLIHRLQADDDDARKSA